MVAAASRTLTFLFTDIEGSTPLWDRALDAMRASTEQHNALLRTAIAAHGGSAFRVVGDAFCVAFADADSAVRTAVDAQRALSEQPWGEATIRVRMGLHSGAVEPTGDEIFRGPALARTARVMAAAHGEQILVTAATVALLDRALPAGSSLRDLGDHTLRGFVRPEHLYQLVVADVRAEFPPIGTAEALRTNVPPALTSFIGRERALYDVRERTRASRLVTLTGSGGTGKTRLMLEAGRELVDVFPDGVWLVELAALADPAQTAQAIAAALGARGEGDVPALALIEGTLGGKRSLLALDNCEHLVDEAARIALTLLRSLPSLHILATSREALGVEGEVVYRVPSLSLPAAEGPSVQTALQSEAVQLFADRARAIVPGFAVTTGNVGAVVDICRRLDGIPLALELASARLGALSVEALASRLHDRFRVLAGGKRTALPRQRTLRAMVDWSYDLLSDDERSVLLSLSVFSGGFSLAAAESICDRSALRESLLDAVSQLVDKSLVQAELDPQADARYRLLETIRQYTAEKLVDAGRADATRSRHLAYFLNLAERAAPQLRTAAVLEWLDRLESDHDNLRAALEFAADSDPASQARLAGSLHEFWDYRGHFAEGYACLERAVAAHAGEDAARLKALLGFGAFAVRLDQRQRGASMLEAAVELAQRLAEVRLEAEATLWRARALDWRGADFIEPLAERALALCRPLDHAWGIGFATWHFGYAARLRGRPDDAQRLFLESAAQYERGGCVLMAAMARSWAGQIAIERLDFAGARRLLEEALADHLRLGNKHEAGTTLRSLAQLDLNEGQLERALRGSEESAGIFRALHDPNCCSRSTAVCAQVLHAMGDFSGALRHAQETAAVAGRLEFHNSRAHALWLAGRSLEAQGDPQAARRAYFEGLREITQASHDAALPGLLEALAGTHPDAPAAARLMGAAAALREARQAAVFPSERADCDRWLAAVRVAHGAAFEREVSAGATLAREQAIELALALERRED